MRLHRSAKGHAHLSVPYDERLVGDPQTGVLHGGVITALLDSASGSAVLSAGQNPMVTATLDLRIDYMRPATVGQTVHATAECYRMTRSIAFTRAVAYHTDPDDPIAVVYSALEPCLSASRLLSDTAFAGLGGLTPASSVCVDEALSVPGSVAQAFFAGSGDADLLNDLMAGCLTEEEWLWWVSG